MSEQVDVVRRLFKAVEERDLQGLLDCYDERVEIHEAASLPDGGVYHGRDGAVQHAMGFLAAWGTHQGDAEQRLDARFFVHDSKHPSALVVGSVRGAGAGGGYPACDTLLSQPCRPDAFTASDPPGKLLT
jgi:hypothetical protein